MRITAVLLAAIALVMTGAASPARAQEDGSVALSVMTRNQFFGGDLIEVSRAPDLPSFLAAARAVLMDMAANNFLERAQAHAREIAERRPHVVGLQEVAVLTVNNPLNGTPPFIDQLALTMQALEAAGADYRVVAQVREMDLTVPVDLDGNGVPESLVRFTDRDVMIARGDIVDAGLVTPVPFSSFCARPAPDGGPGCNYVTKAAANTPLGPLALERGFVGVDVTLGARTFRVVNTHLEVENLTSDPWAPVIQSAQAMELKATIDAISAGKSVVVMGDINSTPNDPTFPAPPNMPGAPPLVRPFQQFANGVDMFGSPAGAPYHDTWLLRPGEPTGLTCCNEDLTSPAYILVDRKDVVFSRDLPVSLKANLVGNNAEDRTASGLWPSDHAGVWVRFRF